jgi:hypothetical protein
MTRFRLAPQLGRVCDLVGHLAQSYNTSTLFVPSESPSSSNVCSSREDAEINGASGMTVTVWGVDGKFVVAQPGW